MGTCLSKPPSSEHTQCFVPVVRARTELVCPRISSRFNRHNLETDDIMMSPSRDFAFVHASHPIAEMLETDGASLLDDEWYKITSDTMHKCVAVIRTEMRWFI